MAFLVLMMILPASSETSPAGDHIGVVGEHGIDEFLINWTDDKNYSVLKPSVEKWDDQTTNFNLYARENSTGYDSTLWYDISWHPEEKRRSTLKPEKYPWEITADEIDLRSDISIQGKKGILVRIKEEKIYNGPGNKPTIIDPLFYACYFPDEYTEVIIRGPTAKWTESEFKSLLGSVMITPPAGYY